MKYEKIPFIRNPIEVIDDKEEPDIAYGNVVARYLNPASFEPKYLVECEGNEYYITPFDLLLLKGVNVLWSVMGDGGVHHKGLYYHNSGKKPDNWMEYKQV